MLKRSKNINFLYIAVVLFFTSCQTARYVPEGSFLLKKNTINTKVKKLALPDVSGVIKQKANRKIFGTVPFFLYAYNFGRRLLPKKQGGFLSNKLGESPVLYDANLAHQSVSQISQFLSNKGYFDNQVSFHTDTLGRKKNKIKVVYDLIPGIPDTIVEISHTIEDDHLVSAIKAMYREKRYRSKIVLKKGILFDVDRFEKDRDLITKYIKSKGYFSFKKEHVSYQIDTTYGTHKLKVIQNISKEKRTIEDTVLDMPHRVYHIHSVDVLHHPEDSVSYTDSCLSFGEAMLKKIKPSFLKQNIFVLKNEKYNIENQNLTYSKLLPLKLFRQVQMSYKDISAPTDSLGHLDVSILLPTLPTNLLEVEFNGTHTVGNLGISSNINLRKKNIFKRGEILTFRGIIGLEAQGNNSNNTLDLSAQESVAGVFNTLNYGAEISILNQRLLLPFVHLSYRNIIQPQTEFILKYNHQLIPIFKRDIFGFTYKYAWQYASKNAFSITPIDINLVRIPTQSFKDTIEALGNPYLQNTYQDHFLLGSKIQFRHSKRTLLEERNSFSYELGFESYGSLLNLIYKLSNPNPVNTTGEFFGVQYAHFTKFNVELKQYQIINRNTRMIYRAYLGLGVPLANSSALPFEKAFFGGGANGLRAWKIRALGPGSFYDPTISSFFRIGDMQLESNLEYRFGISEMFEGALFVDLGNIWLYNKDGNREGADFSFSRFYNELAIGSGLGLRIDFTFFLVRFDWGLQLREPGLAKGERWIFQPKQQFETTYNTSYKIGSNLNIGIGYPF